MDPGAGSIIVTICSFLVLAVPVYLFVNEPMSENSPSPANEVMLWLQRFPTEPRFYYLIAAFSGMYLGLRWYEHAKLHKEFKTKEDVKNKNGLTSRDCWIAKELRARAFALRMRADVLLGGVLLLLFSGVYLTLFGLPQIQESDRLLAQKIRLSSFKKEYSNQLKLISEGRYWFKIDETASRRGDQLPSNQRGSRLRPPSFLQTYEISKKERAIVASAYGKILMTKDDGQSWNIPEGLKLKEDEWIDKVVFGADDKHGLVASDEGSIFLTKDGGQSWSISEGLKLKEYEWIDKVKFNADGKHGLVAGVQGSIFLTKDGGQSWSISEGLKLKEYEWIDEVVFGADGKHVLVAGDEGSIFVTKDGGQSWNIPEGLKLKEDEWIDEVVFGADGKHVLVAGVQGSIFLTKDGGQSWSISEGLKLKEYEWIDEVVFNADGKHGLVAGDEGSIFLTKDGGQSWSIPEGLKLKEYEWIDEVVFNADGKHGLVAGVQGSIFLTKDGGQSWSIPEGLKLKEDEWIDEVVFNADGKHVLVAGDEGSIFVTKDGGQSWNIPEGLKLKEDEWIDEVIIGADRKHVLVAGNEGSIFVTKDGGQSWSISEGLKLKEYEWIDDVVFNADGKHGLVAGNEGSIFVTKNGGQTWLSTERDSRDSSFVTMVSGSADSGSFVALDDRDGLHLLNAYPNMAQRDGWSLADMRSRIEEGDELLRNSAIGRSITEFLRNGAAPGSDGDNVGNVVSAGSSINRFVDDLTVMRMVTLTVLFFLVQVLVRLHQYSLRLAAFWDSRADSVLLAQSFSNSKAVAFDDLVSALAPDAYDFKPPPKPGQDALFKRFRSRSEYREP